MRRFGVDFRSILCRYVVDLEWILVRFGVDFGVDLEWILVSIWSGFWCRYGVNFGAIWCRFVLDRLESVLCGGSSRLAGHVWP